MDNPVQLTVVSTEMEAEMICGLLRTEGIECAQRATGLGTAVLGSGPQEILVAEEDLERARELIA